MFAEIVDDVVISVPPNGAVYQPLNAYPLSVAVGSAAGFPPLFTETVLVWQLPTPGSNVKIHAELLPPIDTSLLLKVNMTEPACAFRAGTTAERPVG